MTFEEIKASPKETLTANDIAKVVGCDPYALVLCARDKPEKLGFNVVVMGRRVRIPRRAFIAFWEGRQSQDAAV